VLVDNVHAPGADAKNATQPLSTAQIDSITRLVKNAVGFDEARGDSVNVVNAPFLEEGVTLEPEAVPIWQRPWVRDVARLVLGALVLIALALGVLRPLIKNLGSMSFGGGAPTRQLTAEEQQSANGGGSESAPAPANLAYEQQIVNARNLVAQDPKRVAQVVKTWVAES